MLLNKKKLLLKYGNRWLNYNPEYFCPCCGYKTIEKRGNYEICPVCYWEDEFNNEKIISDQEYLSGPNKMTLLEAKKNFYQYGVCDKKLVKNVIAVNDRDEIFEKLII